MPTASRVGSDTERLRVPERGPILCVSTANCQRTSVGFDSRDDILDIAVASDLSAWQPKNADEVDFAVEIGLITRDDRRMIRAAAQAAVDAIVERRSPFDEATWSCRPPAAWDHLEVSFASSMGPPFRQ